MVIPRVDRDLHCERPLRALRLIGPSEGEDPVVPRHCERPLKGSAGGRYEGVPGRWAPAPGPTLVAGPGRAVVLGADRLEDEAAFGDVDLEVLADGEAVGGEPLAGEAEEGTPGAAGGTV